ncbi:hypothetical protein ACWC3X_36660 [Streptomyces populi]|jgi:hypothetical protein
MRFARAAACTFVLTLVTLLGGLTASAGAGAQEKIPQHTAAFAAVADTNAPGDDHGNG